MPKVLVLFHSRTGHTARLADAIAEGARSVRFTEVDVRRLDDLPAAAGAAAAEPAVQESQARLRQQYRALESVDELAAYDALVLGSPSSLGAMSAELKHVLDQLGARWASGAFVDRVGSAFTSAQTAHGGHELALLQIMTPMCTLGMILVPPGYSDPVMLAGGSPFGATTTGGGEPTDADLAAARHQGRRVAKVAEWVRHAKGHEAGHGHHHH